MQSCLFTNPHATGQKNTFPLDSSSRSWNNWFILEKRFEKIGVLKPVTPSFSFILLLWKYFCFLGALYSFIQSISTEVSNLSGRMRNCKMSLALIDPLLGVISKVTGGIGSPGWSAPHDSNSCFILCSINPAANGLNPGKDSTGRPGGSWGMEWAALMSHYAVYESSMACRHPREPCPSSNSWPEWGWDWGAETNLL